MVERRSKDEERNSEGSRIGARIARGGERKEELGLVEQATKVASTGVGGSK